MRSDSGGVILGDIPGGSICDVSFVSLVENRRLSLFDVD